MITDICFMYSLFLMCSYLFEFVSVNRCFVTQSGKISAIWRLDSAQETPALTNSSNSAPVTFKDKWQNLGNIALPINRQLST